MYKYKNNYIFGVTIFNRVNLLSLSLFIKRALSSFSIFKKQLTRSDVPVKMWGIAELHLGHTISTGLPPTSIEIIFEKLKSIG